MWMPGRRRTTPKSERTHVHIMGHSWVQSLKTTSAAEENGFTVSSSFIESSDLFITYNRLAKGESLEKYNLVILFADIPHVWKTRRYDDHTFLIPNNSFRVEYFSRCIEVFNTALLARNPLVELMVFTAPLLNIYSSNLARCPGKSLEEKTEFYNTLVSRNNPELDMENLANWTRSSYSALKKLGSILTVPNMTILKGQNALHILTSATRTECRNFLDGESDNPDLSDGLVDGFVPTDMYIHKFWEVAAKIKKHKEQTSGRTESMENGQITSVDIKKKNRFLDSQQINKNIPSLFSTIIEPEGVGLNASTKSYNQHLNIRNERNPDNSIKVHDPPFKNRNEGMQVNINKRNTAQGLLPCPVLATPGISIAGASHGLLPNPVLTAAPDKLILGAGQVRLLPSPVLTATPDQFILGTSQGLLPCPIKSVPEEQDLREYLIKRKNISMGATSLHDMSDCFSQDYTPKGTIERDSISENLAAGVSTSNRKVVSHTIASAISDLLTWNKVANVGLSYDEIMSCVREDVFHYSMVPPP